jgi:DNA-binding NarL/FixJ family response regulator
MSERVPPERAGARASERAEVRAGDPVRVLLADDQRLVRESLATLLGLLDGIELAGCAADGEEALALVARQHPDVVLMDLRMPHMDGIEATRRLRERHPQVRVIALTTDAEQEDVLAALRAGARGYLTKDAGSEDIRAAILGWRQARRRLTRPCSITSWRRLRRRTRPSRAARSQTTSPRARRRCWR